MTKLGIRDKFLEWLKSFNIDLGGGASINALDAWNEALVLDIGNEMYKPYIEMAREHFRNVLTEEQFDQILLSCKVNKVS